MGLYPGRKGAYITATEVGTESSPTYTGLTLSGLTASTVVYSNASKAITSLANGAGYLLNDGSGGLSWAAVSLSGYLKADGTVPLTADWNVGAFDLTAVDVNATNFILGGTGTLTSLAGNATFTTSLTAASGNEAALTLNYTTNKAAGNDTGLVINQTDTASPGTSYLLDLQKGGSSKFSVSNAGLITSTNAINCTDVYRSPASSGNIGFPSTALTGIEITRSSTVTSGAVYCFSIKPTYNQASGTASNTDLLINRTETAVGSGTQRLISGQVGSTELWGVDNRGGMMVGLTPDAIMQVGMVAMADAGTDNRYDINGAAGTLPIGIVGGSGPTAAGTARALVVQGVCYVAPAEDVVSITRGHVCFVDGSDAGYVDDNAALQAAGTNIGIYLNSEAAVAFDGAADVAADGTITLDSDPTAWAVGDPVIYWDSGDTAPAELTTGGVYWIQSKTGANVKLAATRGGAAIALSDGSGTTMYLMRLPKVILNWR